jgi:methionine sulfoxide reductase heme-binding subunit
LSPAARLIAKPLVFAACLLPALKLGAGAFNLAGWSLGADPVAALLHTCGRWTLNFLLITLCMTPLQDFTGWSHWLRFRRMFGLFAFFYLLMHFSVFVLLDQAGKLPAIGHEIVKRPYITLGMLGLLLLIPLALTSTAKAQRRMGRRWTQLHQLIYPVALLGVWHFWWQVKKDIRLPLLYACGLALLLGYRLWKRHRFALPFSVARLARTDGVSAAAPPCSANPCTDR